MTKKLSPLEKQARRPASRACSFCHSKHLQCSNNRPCKNCVKRNIADQCRDVERKRANYMTLAAKNKQGSPNTVLPESSSSPFLPLHKGHINSQSLQPLDPSSGRVNTDFFLQLETTVPLPWPMDLELKERTNAILNTTDDVLNKILYDEQASKVPSAQALEMTPSNSSIDGVFNSNYLNQEYLMLGDIILNSKPASPTPSSTSEYQTIPPNEMMGTVDYNEVYRDTKSKKLKESRPFISLGFSNPPDLDNRKLPGEINIANEIMDPSKRAQVTTTNDYVSPLVTRHIYQLVQDIYANKIINYEYPTSYHALTFFLKKRFLGTSLPPEQKQQKRNNLLIILKLIASYRPTFISAHKSLLKPYDLMFLEMTFQRSLIDYEKLLHLNSLPTIIWRRTGEIVSISDEILSLLGYSLNSILSKRTFIMELMYDDESIINYFKLFKSVAVGNLHLSIITRCKLMKNPDRDRSTRASTTGTEQQLTEADYIEFCAVWTVKRDLFDLPMLIMGQFLPVLPAGDGVRRY
ncbi:putative zinc cluster protein of unknown function [Naganishia cerealis]|uniref:Uncharacterized protein n=1 Tax=Naganishia cerealis TaxID=610337 RepID=A0ACC2VDD1_9TREE|nr:putative zinc cluster protein of unknown function [Naganishia cerealis]